MKYIVCRIERDGEFFMDVPFLFPNNMVHSIVFTQMRAMLEMQYFKHGVKTEVKALSAGEFSSTILIDDDAFTGESTSLGIRSRKADKQLMSMCDYGSCSMGLEDPEE